MIRVIVGGVLLALGACVSQQAPAFQPDGEGYYRLPLGAGADALDTKKIGDQLALGEIYCRERGQTAETGFVTGPNGSFIRFRCVDEAKIQK